MAFTEEVYKNKGKWFGAHTGKEYSSSEVENFGNKNDSWSKPAEQVPGEVILEVEKSER